MALILRDHSRFQLWNSLKYVLSLSLSKRKEYLNYYPISLTIYVTDRCTLKCNMCIHHSPNMPKNFQYYHDPCDMSFDTFKKIIDKFKYANNLDLIGVGEPFLNDDIFDMIKEGNMHKMRVSSVTNGTILHDKIEDIIKSPLDSLSISLDAHNANAYYKMRGGSKKTFDTVLENINTLVEKRNKNKCKLELRLSYICTKTNYKYMPDMVKLADDLGVDALDFQNLIPNPMQGFTEDQCLYEDDHDVIDVIQSVDKPKSELVVYMPKLLQRTVTDRLCESYFRNIYIDGKGNVCGCGRVETPNQEYGNVFKEKDVWNNNYFRQMRMIYLNNSIALPDRCRTCVNNSKYKQIVLC